MHYLAPNFASQLKEQIEKEHLMEFGPTFEYKMVFIGKTDSGKFVSIEEYIVGDFIKYITKTVKYVKRVQFVTRHRPFSTILMRNLRVTLLFLTFRVLGTHYMTQKLHDGTYQFCTENLFEIAMKKLFEKHQCNKYRNF